MRKSQKKAKEKGGKEGKGLKRADPKPKDQKNRIQGVVEYQNHLECKRKRNKMNQLLHQKYTDLHSAQSQSQILLPPTLNLFTD
jgi:hypothetical protein